MFKVSSLLPKAIKKAGIAGQVKDTQVIKCFNDSRDRLLRPEVARKVRAMYIKNGVLNIHLPKLEPKPQQRPKKIDIK